MSGGDVSTREINI